MTNPYCFTGRELDTETYLYYYRARYYDAEAGRFIQKDPIGMILEPNLYTYVDNNPINMNDPMGLGSWEVITEWLIPRPDLHYKEGCRQADILFDPNKNTLERIGGGCGVVGNAMMTVLCIIPSGKVSKGTKVLKGKNALLMKKVANILNEIDKIIGLCQKGAADYSGKNKDTGSDGGGGNDDGGVGTSGGTLMPISAYTQGWWWGEDGNGGGGAQGDTQNNPGDDTLPVTLSSFTVTFDNGATILAWTTQSETNNLGWNIYRSVNDSLEQAIQINIELIPGAGTTSEPTEYIFEDEFEVIENTEYWYWLESIDLSGLTDNYGPISLIIPEGGEEPGSPEIPYVYGLHQNYPNPFNPNTEISFMMKEDCVGELLIYNIKGQKVKTLFTKRSIPKDELIIYIWNGKDEYGKEVSSGIYLYKLRTNKEDYNRRMILMK